MTKFKVGDKVRILDASQSDHQNGDVGEIIRLTRFFGALMHEVNVNGNVQGHFERDIELVSDKPTKNQRLTDAERAITTLESEVAELKAKVEALEALPKPTEVAEMFALAQLEAQIKATERSPKRVKPKSPNEQRKAIIAEAKAFVTELIDENGVVQTKGIIYPDVLTNPHFVVNAEKRTVTVVLKGIHSGIIYAKAIAKCAPDDVFNADIGKAIALGRALGLDVSRFEQAVKPTEVVGGMKAKCLDNFEEEYTATIAGGRSWAIHSVDCLRRRPNKLVAIIDDTEAVY